MLLACKEDSLPYALDPQTLETIGLWDFDGQLESATFTAHPKFDPKTREMVCFGYEAKGDGTPDVCYYTFDSQAKLLQTVWLVAPVVAMIHDFAVTQNYVCGIQRFIPGCFADRFRLSSQSFPRLVHLRESRTAESIGSGILIFRAISACYLDMVLKAKM